MFLSQTALGQILSLLLLAVWTSASYFTSVHQFPQLFKVESKGIYSTALF